MVRSSSRRVPTRLKFHIPRVPVCVLYLRIDHDTHSWLGHNSIFSISGSSQGQGVIGFAHRKSHRKLSGGQIAGIVVGSLAFAVLLGIGVFLMYRRYKRREARETPTPDISPPLTPGRPLLIESQGRNTAAFSIASPPFDRDEFGVRPPPSEGQEVMVAFPSSVFTPLRANYTPTESSFTETPPPYHHENPTPHRQVLQSQKSQTTFQSSDIA
ncbi:hypothetical protein GYMLUDRAFT_266646 [Collybiopsis luxurians FD-317 M1]|nr:hypothetical protein GYMLUDRAFT_266646 [Collybiopsis luxurians FD-317 M1]